MGEIPRSVEGSKAYELVLKQPVQGVGKVVQENVFTTGRVTGLVVVDLRHKTVSVSIEDWFLKSEVFKKGRWDRLDTADQIIRARDGVHPALAVPRLRGGEN